MGDNWAKCKIARHRLDITAKTTWCSGVSIWHIRHDMLDMHMNVALIVTQDGQDICIIIPGCLTRKRGSIKNLHYQDIYTIIADME